MNDDIEIDALRILCILRYCGSQLTQLPMILGDVSEREYTHSIDSESKLQKLDFWLRYPDHLAAAFLRGCEDGSLRRDQNEIKSIIRQIFADEEPDLRATEMMRYFYGAYEPLDTVMIFLTSRSLAYRRLDVYNPKTTYYLTEPGCKALQALVDNIPEVQWYVERCKLIHRFFGHLDGFDMRIRQYLEDAYRNASPMTPIPRVDKEVYVRFERYFKEPM